MKNTRITKSETRVLELYAIAALGGDPDMSFIGATMILKLDSKGLVRKHTAEESQRLLRHRVPTAIGWCLLLDTVEGPVGPSLGDRTS